MATTVLESIEKAITDRVKDNWTATAIQYPNTVKDMSGESSWLSVDVVHISAQRLTMTGGADTGIIYKGQVVMNIYRLSGKGTGTVKSLVDDAADLFRYVRLSVAGGNTIQFYVPQISVAGLRGQWWQETVTIPFEYLT